jgi:inosine-uridine nucleoside N-ribohydrolase
MILFTDIGKDIDDAVALTYAIIAGIPIKAIVCTSKEVEDSASICQNIINNLADKFPACKDIKIFSGSTDTKKSGVIHSNIYMGPFSKGKFKFDKIEDAKLAKDEVICIGPLTDLL